MKPPREDAARVQCEFASPRGKYWDIVGLAELKVRRGIAKQVAGTDRPPGRVAPVVFLQLSDKSFPRDAVPAAFGGIGPPRANLFLRPACQS